MPSVSVDMTRSLDYSDFLSSKCCVSDTKKSSLYQTKFKNALNTLRQLSDTEPEAIEYIESKLNSGSGLVDAIRDYLAGEGFTFDAE